MKTFVTSSLLFVLAACTALQLHAQVLKPDLQNLSQWKAINRSVEAVDEDGKKAVRFNAAEGEGF
jgi:hypothetical protein